MAGEKILVVDDELDFRHLLRLLLEKAQFQVATTATAAEALASLKKEAFDLVLLDVMMPLQDGFEACREIRQLALSATSRTVPIILLSARSETYDQVVGLEAGADDFVVKPFVREELISRIRALLRRAQVFSQETLIATPSVQVGPLRLDPPTQRAFLGPQELTLTNKEFDLLYLLARHVGRVLSRGALLEKVWEDELYGDSKTLDVHIYRLRKKFDAVAGWGSLLETLRGRGYRLKDSLLSMKLPPEAPER